jgi:hypothetical protein
MRTGTGTKKLIARRKLQVTVLEWVLALESLTRWS